MFYSRYKKCTAIITVLPRASGWELIFGFLNDYEIGDESFFRSMHKRGCIGKRYKLYARLPIGKEHELAGKFLQTAVLDVV